MNVTSRVNGVENKRSYDHVHCIWKAFSGFFPSISEWWGKSYGISVAESPASLKILTTSWCTTALPSGVRCNPSLKTTQADILEHVHAFYTIEFNNGKQKEWVPARILMMMVISSIRFLGGSYETHQDLVYVSRNQMSISLCLFSLIIFLPYLVMDLCRTSTKEMITIEKKKK